MDNILWLNRKYPKSAKRIMRFLNKKMLSEFKKSTNRIGVLRKTVETYSEGALVLFRKTSACDFNHPMVYIIAKCKKGFTASGYHAFDICGYGEDEIKELTE